MPLQSRSSECPIDDGGSLPRSCWSSYCAAWPRPAHAQTCAPAWSASQVYTAGNQASLGGINYQANWWTLGESPSTHNGGPGSGQPWTNIGTCSGSGGCTVIPSVPSGLSGLERDVEQRDPRLESLDRRSELHDPVPRLPERHAGLHGDGHERHGVRPGRQHDVHLRGGVDRPGRQLGARAGRSRSRPPRPAARRSCRSSSTATSAAGSRTSRARATSTRRTS